jgi:sporulation protein YlmC with PRC-barrel domain
MRYQIPWALTALAACWAAVPLAADEPKEEREAGKPAAVKPSADAAESGAKVKVASIFRAADILNLDVRNTKGKDIGSLNDLVIELETGEIRYVALSFGGFAGFNDKLFAVPWKAVKFKFDENDRFLVVDVTEEQLERARGFDENHWPNFADKDWAAQTEKDFNTAEEASQDEAKEAKEPSDAGLEKAGDKVVYDAIFRVSSLKGMEVRNAEDESLGQINELVFDLEQGKVAYVALSHGGVLGVGSKLFAVPFGAFTLKLEADEKFMVLDISAEKLKSAPGFDADHWPDMADRDWAADIDRHYELSRKPAEGKTKTPRRE